MFAVLALGEERAAIPMKGKVTEDNIVDHLKAEKLPPTIAFNDKNSQKIFSSGVEKQVSTSVGLQLAGLSLCMVQRPDRVSQYGCGSGCGSLVYMQQVTCY